MPEQPRPLSPQQAPDTARSYERAKPEAESGMGRLDNNTNAVPTDHPDHTKDAVGHAQAPRQLNSDDVVNNRVAGTPGQLPPPAAVDHSDEGRRARRLGSGSRFDQGSPG